MCKPLGAQSIFSLSSYPQEWRFFLKTKNKKAITFSATHCSAFHKREWAMSKATIRPSSEPRLYSTVIFLFICMHSFKLASERPYVSQHIRKRDRVSCSQSLCCSIFVSDWSAGAFYLFIFPLEVTHYPREPFFLPFAMQNQDTLSSYDFLTPKASK